MPKMFTDLKRHALNGATMGARWSALFHSDAGFDIRLVRAAMAAAVAEVDGQMSTWKPDSDLNRLNVRNVGEWIALPQRLLAVMAAGLAIGRASDGAFDIGMGDAVAAWGFGPEEANEERIRAARLACRRPAHEVLEIDEAGGRARKHAEIHVNLNGIAKGYGVDRLTEVARDQGLDAGLFAIDGELRALGSQPNGKGWTIAVEAPDMEVRAAHSVLELHDAAVATSGDYRHWLDVGGRRLSHTMNPRLGMPLIQAPSSVTVIAGDCMSADAWATAMMVVGEAPGLLLAEKLGHSVLFLYHDQKKRGGCGLFTR